MHGDEKPSKELLQAAHRAADAALRYWFSHGLSDEQIAERIGEDVEWVAEARARLAPQPRDEKA